jgi:hypothetical protein
VADFVGCGALLRTAAVRAVGGYSSFFTGEYEEQEYCLRFLEAGWSVYFFSGTLIHHRVSPKNRQSTRSWVRGFRNKLWARVMHYPLHRLLLEGAWVVCIAAWDSLRLLRFRSFFRAIFEFTRGLPAVVRLRQPMSPQTLRLYDAIRFLNIQTEREYDHPPSFGLKDLWNHFRLVWLRRARQRSVWDRRQGDTGSHQTIGFAHEHQAGSAEK